MALRRVHTGLLDLPIHFLKLVNGELLDTIFDDLDAFMIVGKVWPVAFQANHIECFGRLERAVEMEILARLLRFIEVRRQPAVENRLSLEKIGV